MTTSPDRSELANQLRRQAEDLVGSTVEGKYQVTKRIGAGGMGAVYEATQLGVDRKVALKVIRPEHAKNDKVVKRFMREMKATARIEHPNTVRLYDFGKTEGGLIYLAVEFLSGTTLNRELKNKGRFPPERVAIVGAQIARGLAAAHAEGIIHRDLKPPNIMLTEQYGSTDRVKVLDFGIAHFADPSDDDERERLTQSGMVMGTPEFMAPEQVTPGPVDARADLYALGCVLFLMATGEVPFGGSTAVNVMFSHVNDAPRTPSEIDPDIPRWLDDIILKLLEKNPRRRFQEAAEIVEALEEGAGIDVTTDTPPLPRIDNPAVVPRDTENTVAGFTMTIIAGAVAIALVLGAAIGAIVALVMMSGS